MKVISEDTNGVKTTDTNVRVVTIELANGDVFDVKDFGALRVRSANGDHALAVVPDCSNVVKIYNREL